VLQGPRAHASSPSVAADPIAHQHTPSAEVLQGPRAHASSPSVAADPIAHQHIPSAEVLQGPRAHASSPSVAADPIAHQHTPSAEVLQGPRAHASSPSVAADPIAHSGTPSAEVLQGPRAHASSPSVAADPIAHSGTPSAELLTGAHAHASSPPAEFPRGQAPIAHEEIEFEDLPPAPLARPDDAEVTGPTILGALRGLAGALRSAVGLASRASEVDAWGKDKSLAASLRPLGELLYEKYWRVRVEGAEHLPSGPFIIVANHAGALPLDGPVMHLALRKERPDLPEARWLLEDQIFHAPFVGVLANRLGAVRASPENATRLLGEGRPLIVYPEGFHGLSKPFSERYQLRRFGRGGYLKIALRTGVPIVPAAIVGGEESMPLLATLPGGLFGVEYLPLTLPPLPARWHLRFAEPVSLDGAPDEPDHDLAWIERKNLAVRDQIEGMLTDLLQHRESVF
jgi:1-acyl-sn-glycerol-3-phosphate acyltransferase